MPVHRIIFLLILLSIVGCSSKVTKDDNNFSEQVDLKELNPLAQISFKQDPSQINFETFSNYSEKKIPSKSVSKEESNLQKSRYYVQVGLTDSFDEISQLKNQLIVLFPDEKIEINYDAPFYRILIGPLDSKSKANEIFIILERKNFSSIRIRTETTK